MRTHRWTLAAGLLALVAPPISAQQVTMHGQVRPRYEFKDPSGGGQDEFTSMRVRLGLQAVLDDNVSIFLQAQDVRIWGEETHPLRDFSADNFDLHQGYLRYKGKDLEWMTATIGRMETNFGGQRLVGAVGWTQQAQSFDGVRIDGAADWGKVSMIAYKIGDETAPAVEADHELYGAYATVADVGPGGMDLYWLYDRTEGISRGNEHSLGARYAFSGAWSGRLEGTYQTGTRAGTDVSAYMFGARLGRALADGKAGITLWYDYLSGDDAATVDTEVFNTLFATNHKFYGFADVFLNIPKNTGGAGLQDMAVKFNWKPRPAIRFAADLHSFSAAEQGTLSDSHFANELDLTLSHRYTEHLSATVGFSYVDQDAALAEVGRLSENMTWFYVMLDAVF
jgi:Alginate export